MPSGTKSKWTYNEGQYSGLINLCDGTIVTEDGCSFHVHKVILAKRSSFFKDLFCGMDSDKSEHRMSNMNGGCLGEILNYIYSNDICVTETNITDLLVAADYFSLEDLKLKLSKYVKTMLTDDNCLKLCCTGYQMNEKDILQNSFLYIERRFQMIIERNRGDFIDLPKEILKDILNKQNLNVDSEPTVWKAIVYWTQANIESRLKDVPSLLTTLAIDEIGTDLATDIINHDIVVNNLHMKPLIDNCAKSFYGNGSDGYLISLLRKFSNDFPLKNFRIPGKLNIISKYIVEKDISEIYISYDETLDLWRKIAEVHLNPDYLAVIEWNIFMFNAMEVRTLNVDLRTPALNTMPGLTMPGRLSDDIIVIGNCLYRIGSSNGKTYIHIYDSAINRWFRYELLNYPLEVHAVAIRENIFVVGVDENNMTEMIALVFNSITRQHMFLARPNVIRCAFNLVVYHEKIYLIGGLNSGDKEVPNVEVFSPTENLWKEVQPIPIHTFLAFFNVFNDQLIVYIIRPMKDENPNAVRWNEFKECWETLHESEIVEDLWYYQTCSIDDTEKIQFLTKQNRKSGIQMEKSPFFFW